MQKTVSMSCFALGLIFFYLFSLPGMFVSQSHAQETPKFTIQDSFEYCSPDATRVDVQFQTFENATMQAIIDEAIPVSDEFLNDPDNSFFKGFVDAIKERYPFGEDTSLAMINIAEDALIVVIGIGITIVITGVTAALAAAGAASAGTVLVAVLIAGAALGLVFVIGTIINEYLKGNKADAGAKTFNLVRELILLLAGGTIATKAFASKTASQAIKLAKYLENKVPEAMAWLRESVNPICQRIVLWVKDMPFKLGLLARGEKPNALNLLIEKGKFSEVDISHLYKDPNGNTALWRASDDPEFVLLSFNGAAPIKPTYNQARLSLQGGKFELVESHIKLQNPEGKVLLWKKIHGNHPDEYIRIAGGDYINAVTASEELAFTEAAFSEIRLNTDGTVTKVFHEIEPGIIIGDPAYEARMMKLWDEINPSSSPVLIEEGSNFVRMTRLNGKPLGSYKPGELKLNPGAWDRFVNRVYRFHDNGYVYNDLGSERNIFIVNGEIHILDFGVSKVPDASDVRFELEALEPIRQYLIDLGIKNLKPVQVPVEQAVEAVSAGG